jgi:hypothetical protein
MKNTFRILSCLLITVTSYSALAQAMITISQALDYWISNVEKDVVSAATAMPEILLCTDCRRVHGCPDIR